MKKNKNFKFYVNVEKENTSNIYDVSEKDMFYLEEDTILDVSWMSKKQLDLYIFRNKEIKKIKNWKTKLISMNILNHVLRNFKRIKNSSSK